MKKYFRKHYMLEQGQIDKIAKEAMRDSVKQNKRVSDSVVMRKIVAFYYKHKK